MTRMPTSAAALPDRRLVLHADDFGMSRAVTEGILRGFTHGLLTSTSLLANAPHAGEALVDWKRLKAAHATGCLPSSQFRIRLQDAQTPFDLGIHLNLTQGRPLTGSAFPDELLEEGGCFPGIGRAFLMLCRSTSRFIPGVRNELAAQIEVMLDHGLPPTHLNGHQYVELLPGLKTVIPELLRRYQIPCVRVAHEPGRWRNTLLAGTGVGNWCLAEVKFFFAHSFRRRIRKLNDVACVAPQTTIAHPDAYFGTSHAGRINLNMMRRFLNAPDLPNVIEIGLHPGTPTETDSTSVNAAEENGWRDPLEDGRVQELTMLESEELVILLEQQRWKLGRLSELPRGDFSSMRDEICERLDNNTRNGTSKTIIRTDAGGGTHRHRPHSTADAGHIRAHR